eukprot:GHVL01005271.1.p1 GENE.GHVL01005271.1~~GHVL01005271.1.p1  ORF type:complete len:442 (-),score=83.93 GHVL01005271.1:655-1980(-)
MKFVKQSSWKKGSKRLAINNPAFRIKSVDELYRDNDIYSKLSEREKRTLDIKSAWISKFTKNPSKFLNILERVKDTPEDWAHRVSPLITECHFTPNEVAHILKHQPLLKNVTKYWNNWNNTLEPHEIRNIWLNDTNMIYKNITLRIEKYNNIGYNITHLRNMNDKYSKIYMCGNPGRNFKKILHEFDFTEEELKSMFYQEPRLFRMNYERSIRQKMWWLINKAYRLPRDILEWPHVLCYSLRLRIMTRANLLKDKFNDFSLNNIYIYNDELFRQNYNITFQDWKNEIEKCRFAPSPEITLPYQLEATAPKTIWGDLSEISSGDPTDDSELLRSFWRKNRYLSPSKRRTLNELEQDLNDLEIADYLWTAGMNMIKLREATEMVDLYVKGNSSILMDSILAENDFSKIQNSRTLVIEKVASCLPQPSSLVWRRMGGLAEKKLK